MKTLLFFLIAFLLLITSTYAQYGNPNCPGDSADCTAWDSTVVNKLVQLSHVHDQYASITYRFRYCNGILEFFIDSIQVIDNAGFLRDFNIEHYDFATLRSVIELGLITDHEKYFGINNGTDSLPKVNIADSNTFNCRDTVSLVNFYSASCGVFLRCEYVRINGNRTCDSGYDPTWYPEWTFQGVNKIFIDTWYPCGENCCKRSYKICRSESKNDQGIYDPKFLKTRYLKIVSTNIESISWCSDQQRFDKTCYTNCWNTP